MSEGKLNYETLQLCEGQAPDKIVSIREVPMNQISFYVFKNSDHASNLSEYIFKYYKYYKWGHIGNFLKDYKI